MNNTIHTNGIHCSDLPSRMRNVFCRYRKPFLILYLYAVLLNLALITQRLSNDLDGLWNQDDYLAGTWELSIGRWLWPLLDRLRFGISLDPLPALLGLAMYVLSFLLILNLLELSFSPLTGLMGAIFLSAVGITCQMSFGYMAITFSTSFLLSVLPVWILVRDIRRRKVSELHGRCSVRQMLTPKKGVLNLHSFLPSVLLSALCIGCMMGLYQAGIGTTCLLSLFVLLHSLVRESSSASKRIAFLLQILAATVLGGIFYILMLRLCLAVTGTAASDYQGFSSISPAYLIAGFPSAVRHSYAALQHYFADGIFRSNRLIGSKGIWVLYLPFLLILFACVKRIASRHSLPQALLFIAGILVSPVAANCFYLLAPETETHMQMTVSMGLMLPLILGFAAAGRQSACGRRSLRNPIAVLTLLCSLLILYGNSLQCITDQYAMLAGRRATRTLAEGILAEANRQGYDLINGQILITDSPYSSKTFCTADLYNEANSYAQYGNWSHEESFSRVSWSKFYSNYLRINVSFASGDTEATIAALPEVAAMPSYPAQGSVQNIYGVLVVKLGE